MQSPAVPDVKRIGAVKFLHEARAELKKVNWPTRMETFRFTAVVIVISVIVAVYIGGLDALFLTITQRTLGK